MVLKVTKIIQGSVNFFSEDESIFRPKIDIMPYFLNVAPCSERALEMPRKA